VLNRFRRLRRSVQDFAARIEPRSSEEADGVTALLEKISARHRDHVEDLAERQRAHLEEVLRQQRKDTEDTMRRELDGITAAMRQIEQRARRDIYAAGQWDAVLSSARFARRVMPAVPVFAEPLETLAYALEIAPPEGMVLEFGVSGGRTLQVLARARNGRGVYGFDSFQGLPEDWRSTVRAGAYKVETPPTIEGAELIIGMFASTLPSFLAEHVGPLALVHMDADLYSATESVLGHIGPRLHTGTVIVFDEYFNYAGWEDHEHRAWQECVSRNGIHFAYEGYTVNHEQVIVRVLAVESPAATVSGTDACRAPEPRDDASSGFSPDGGSSRR
jgi:hypothetical protein